MACEKVGIRVVDTRHEATAVFAADAVSRLSGIDSSHTSHTLLIHQSLLYFSTHLGDVASCHKRNGNMLNKGEPYSTFGAPVCFHAYLLFFGAV